MSARIDRFIAKVERIPFSTCHWWVGAVGGSRYGNFWNGDAYVNAHRYAYQVYVGEIPDGLHVCHSCDNRLCVNPNHLWLGTCADNMRDKVEKGRQRPGEEHPAAKITRADVDFIRSSVGVIPQKALAKEFGLVRQTVSDIQRGRIWQ